MTTADPPPVFWVEPPGDAHDRLLDHLMATHSLFGVFDATADVFEVHQTWDPPPADDNLLPGPDYVRPWTSS